MIARALIAVALIAAGTLAPARAHEGWSVSGTVALSPKLGCGNSLTCNRFILSGCDPSLAPAHGTEISIVPLPPDLHFHRARFTWRARVGPATAIQMDYLGGGPGQCLAFDDKWVPGAGSLTEDSGSMEIGLRAWTNWVAVSGDAAVEIEWTMEGIDDTEPCDPCW